MTVSPVDPWSGLEPDEVVEFLRPVPSAWWICGGWALDLWLGRTTRPHADFDVGSSREDVQTMLTSLPGWDAYHAHEGRLEPLPRDELPVSGSVWLRRTGGASWDLQLMPEDIVRGSWCCRRHRGLRLPRSRLTWRTKEGVAVLRPEIQLLYKAKDIRPKDETDFQLVVRSLEPRARCWLIHALETVHPAHPWIARLRGGAVS